MTRRAYWSQILLFGGLFFVLVGAITALAADQPHDALLHVSYAVFGAGAMLVGYGWGRDD